MMLRIRPEAVLDLDEAARWYERRQAGLGPRFLEEIEAVFARMEAGPQRYAVVHGAVRRVLVRRFPFAVYYLLDDTGIVVIAVLHQRRRKDILNMR